MGKVSSASFGSEVFVYLVGLAEDAAVALAPEVLVPVNHTVVLPYLPVQRHPAPAM